MKRSLKNVLSEMECFWVAQKNNFYFGMVLCMLFIVNLPLCMPESLVLTLSPAISVLVYLLIWLFNCRKKIEKREILRTIGSVLLGSLWTLMFAVL